MSKDDKFFQFPVSALQMRKPLGEVTDQELSHRCYSIVEYACIATGFKLDRDERHERASEHDEYHGGLEDWQVALLAGAKTIGVVINRVSDGDRIKAYQDIDYASSGSKYLRLKRTLLFEFAELKNGMSWREFAILCGVLAGVGAHQHVRLSFDYIAVLAAGYSSAAAAKKAKAQLAERHHVRYTVHKLVERGLFAMVAVNKRHNVYSVALGSTALADQLFARAEKQVKRSVSAVSESLQKRIAMLKQSTEQTESQRQKVLDQLRVHG